MPTPDPQADHKALFRQAWEIATSAVVGGRAVADMVFAASLHMDADRPVNALWELRDAEGYARSRGPWPEPFWGVLAACQDACYREEDRRRRAT